VRTVQAGVGAAAGEMVVPLVDYFGHTNIGGVQLLSPADGQAGERVPIVTLDGYNLSACHLVKVDAEGMGPDVLAGMTATIERLRPIVAIECNGVKEGVEIFQANKWRDYGVFLYRTAAFNLDNFKGNGSNFFGVAHESGLLFVPNECAELIPASKPGAELIQISDLDALAIAVLETPRFGDQTAKDRNPSQLRDAIGQIERERMEQLRMMDARLRTVEAELKAAREAAARDISRLEFRATSLAQQLRRAEEQLAGKAGALDAVLKLVEARDQDLRLVEARDQEIRALRESTSWRVTAPLRRFKTTLMSRSR
jgi:hypothetical protein